MITTKRNEVDVTNASMIDRVIGSRLRAERLSQRFDEAKFAERIGVAAERLAAFEAGIARIDARTMVAICQRLNVSPSYFFEPWLEKQSSSSARVAAA